MVILALVAGESVTVAARNCGVGRRTVHRWLREPRFRARLERVQESVAARAVEEIKAGVGKGIAHLLMQFVNAPPGKRNRTRPLRQAVRLMGDKGWLP